LSEESLQQLIETAKTARLRSIAPFSNFLVGAAVKTADGKVYIGCNVESASYGLTVCAERVAIWKALSEGERQFTELAIVADTETLTPPETQIVSIRELLPRAFDARFLSGAAKGPSIPETDKA
jgi:cytidine deaminase